MKQNTKLNQESMRLANFDLTDIGMTKSYKNGNSSIKQVHFKENEDQKNLDPIKEEARPQMATVDTKATIEQSTQTFQM